MNQKTIAISIMTSLLLLWSTANLHAKGKSRGLGKPSWTTPTQLSTDTGQARLEWVPQYGDFPQLYRLTESHNGRSGVSYIDSDSMDIHRVEPGNYRFSLQACRRSESGHPECGPGSSYLTLTVTEAVWSDFDQDRSAVEPEPTTSVEGPAQLRPGHWFNPAKQGQGWSFYWANQLALPEYPANAYDLYAIWYTYESKTRLLNCDPEPGTQCDPDDPHFEYLNYRPVVATIKLARETENSYVGQINITRQGENPTSWNVGYARIIFGADSTTATIDWSAHFKKQPANPVEGSEAIQTLVSGNPASTQNASHYAGLWGETNAAYFLADDVGSAGETVEVIFFDDNGDPTWAQAYQNQVPVKDSTDLCFYYIQGGYRADLEQLTLPGPLHTDCSVENPGPGERNGLRYFEDFELARFWVDFTLPTAIGGSNSVAGGTISIGSSAYPQGLNKSANFHRIWVNGGDACEITSVHPECPVSLSWFTDGNYPAAAVFVLNETTGVRNQIAVSSVPAIENFSAILSSTGAYVFELRMGQTLGSSLIARSAPFTVMQSSIPVLAPHSLAVNWDDQSELAYSVEWLHDGQSGVNHYELEETIPGQAVPDIHILTPGSVTSKSFSRTDGPFGQYRYRVRACDGAGLCSAFTPIVDWNVGGVSALHPWGDNAYGDLTINTDWHYAMGYHFRPEVNGRVVELGGYFDGIKVVKLFDRNSGDLLAQATVNSNNNWSYVPIAPVEIAANEEYTVAVYLEGTGESHRRPISLPGSWYGIEILGTTYISTSANPNARPVNLLTNVMYGQVDIGFNAAASPPPTSTVAFSDSFETGELNELWTQDAQNDWFASTQRAATGSYSAEVDGSASDAQMISAPINLQGSSEATVSFSWFLESGVDSGEYLAFDISEDGGANWLEQARIRGNIDVENTWHEEHIELSSLSALRLRFRGKMSQSSEDANVDDVVVTVAAGPGNTPPIVTHPGDQQHQSGSHVSGLVIEVTDAEGDPVTCAISGLPTGLQEISECTIGGIISAVPGMYAVEVLANDGLVDSEPLVFSWEVTPPDSAGVVDIPDDLLSNVNARTTSHDPTVGALEGGPDVIGGQSVYTIPIGLPPGRQGMEPGLGLVYNSRAGNGVAGMGWSLSGLSGISRCPATVAQDGFLRNPGFTSTDRLCLDGQRLVKVNGGDYWSAGSEYRTEIDGFSRIRLSQGSGAGSTNLEFTVETRSGLVRTYAYRANAHSDQGSQQTFHWLLTQDKDRTGNTVDYFYSELAPGDHQIDHVRYTGFNASIGDRRVEFHYESRCVVGECDQNVYYTAGHKLSHTVRLSEIVTCISSTACNTSNFIRRYSFEHEISDASGRLLLASVTESAWSGANWISLPATTFAWSEEKPEFSAPEVFSRSIDGISTALTNICDYLPINTPVEDLPPECAFYSPVAGHRYPEIGGAHDLDGDGVSELSVTARDSLTSAAPPSEHALSISAEKIQNAYFEAQMTFRPGIFGFNYHQPLGDMNNDGRADLIILEELVGGARELKIAIWDGQQGFDASQSGLSHFEQKATGIIVSGDSKYDAGNGRHGLSQLLIRDINSDGWPDLVLVLVKETGPYLKVYLNDTFNRASNDDVSLCETCQEAHQVQHVMSQYDGGAYVGWQFQRIRDIRDLNGDGLPDLMFEHLSGINLTPLMDQVRFNTSHSSAGATLSFGEAVTLSDLGLPSNIDVQAPHWMDVNGDGLLDVLPGSVVYLNRGIVDGQGLFGAALPITGDALNAPKGTRRVVDWNADGRDDLVFPDISATGLVGEEFCIVKAFAEGEDGQISSYCPISRQLPEIASLHGSLPSSSDYSVYEYDVVQFETTVDSSGEMSVIAHRQRAGYQASPGSRPQWLDFNGDGLIDYANAFFCTEEIDFYNTSPNENEDNCVTQYEAGAVVRALKKSPGASLSEVLGAPLSIRQAGALSGLAPGAAGYSMSIYEPNTYLVMNTSANPPDLLLQVSDGLGNQSEWEYLPLSSKPARPQTFLEFYELPSRDGNGYVENGDRDYFYFSSSMHVVSRYRQTNGLVSGGQAAYNERFYGYEEAVYNNQGRGFQGFRAIHVEDVHHDDPLNDILSHTYFHQIFPLAGRIETVLNYAAVNLDPDEPISEQQLYWGCRKPDGSVATECGIPASTTSMEHGPDAGVFHPVLFQSIRDRHELGRSTRFSRTISNRVFDEFGNVETEEKLTIDSDLLTHEQVIWHRYFIDQANWWINRLEATLISATPTYEASQAVPGYENNIFVSPQSPQHTTVLYGWNNSLRKPACEFMISGKHFSSSVGVGCGTVNSFGNSAAMKSSMSYDYFGNLLSTTVVATTGSGGATTGRQTNSTYSSDHYFPETSTNPEGHSVVTLFDPSHGVPLKIIDSNNLVTMIEYDAFGRETERYHPNECSSGSSTACGISKSATHQHYAPRSSIHLQWSSGCPGPGCKNRPSAYEIVRYNDGQPKITESLNRLSQTLKSTGSSLSGNVQVDTVYNSRGQVKQQSVPYFSGAPLMQSFTYDPIGRTVRKKQPQQRTSSSAVQFLYTHYDYEGLITTIHVTNSATIPAGACANTPSAPLSSSLCAKRTSSSQGQLLSTVDAHGETTKFWYDGQGNPKLIQDSESNFTAANYNGLGHRVYVFDPDMGEWTFSYNGLGELVRQVDGKGQATDFIYDRLGRPLSRSAADGVVDNFDYDVDELGNVINGLIASETRYLDARTPSYLRSYFYDESMRSTGHQTWLGSESGFESFDISIKNDRYFGRPLSITYPKVDGMNTFRTYFRYDNSGFLTEEGNSLDWNDETAFLRQVNEISPRRQVREETYGNGLIINNRYSTATGQMFSSAVSSGLYELGYEYDQYGNLVIAEEAVRNIGESYGYDHLHRLTSSTRHFAGSPVETVTYSYDALGNLTRKSDYAQVYSYGQDAPINCSGVSAAGPHAVTDADSRQFSYDANGNMRCGNAATGYLDVTYNTFNLPVSISRNNAQTSFRYGSDNQRFFQDQGGLSTVYIDKLYERINSQVHKFYIGEYAQVTIGGDSPGTRYFHRDRLNSIVAITDANGIEKGGTGRQFDPFGKPRNEDMSDSEGLLNGVDETTRGFTQHEHLNAVQLIHMNGRAYDYNLGRFLSVDPYIQFPANSQSLNPYSYILNNPMSGTDPSGFATCGVKEEVSCLEDGANTVTDQEGNAIHTIIVAGKGDHVHLSLSSIDQFTGSSPSIHVSGVAGRGEGQNGNEAQWAVIVEGGPSHKIGSSNHQSGSGCSGSGPLQCYRVKNADKDIVEFSRSYSAISGGAAAINGILQQAGAAMGLMLTHVKERLGASEFRLVYNPTEGFWRDLLESTQDKVGRATPAAKQLADVLVNSKGEGGADFVAHSQGGILFSKAMSLNRKNGNNLDSIRVAFHSGANNHWRSNFLMRRTGVEPIGKGYYDAWNDPVPQLIGLRGLFNPVNFVGSLIFGWKIFTSDSQHTGPQP